MPIMQVTNEYKESSDEQENSLIFDSQREESLIEGVSSRNECRVNLNDRARRVAILADAWDKGGEDRQEIANLLKFGQSIAQLRKSQSLTRQQLAERAKIDAEILFRLEKGLLTRTEVEGLLREIAEHLQRGPLALRRQLDELFTTQKGDKDDNNSDYQPP